MKPVPAKVVIGVDAAVGDGGAVGCGVAVGLLVVAPQATSSAARSRLQKASGVQSEMCVNRISIVNFILLILLVFIKLGSPASRQRQTPAQRPWITCLLLVYLP